MQIRRTDDSKLALGMITRTFLSLSISPVDLCDNVATCPSAADSCNRLTIKKTNHIFCGSRLIAIDCGKFLEF